MVNILTSSNDKLLYTISGAILNATMDNELLQASFVEAKAIDMLVDVISVCIAPDNVTESTNTCGMCVRTISNLVESESGLDEFLEGGHLLKFVEMLKKLQYFILAKNLSETEQDRVFDVLEGLVIFFETITESEVAQQAIVRNDFLTFFFDFVNHAHLSVGLDESCSSKYFSISVSIAKIVTNVTMCDAAMEILTNNSAVVSKFKQWCVLKNTSEPGTQIQQYDELRIAGTLCIGNIARSDLLKTETDRLKETIRGKEDVAHNLQILHAIVGALKNLSLAESDRSLIGSSGTIDKISALLEFPELKLIHPNYENVYRFLTGLNPPVVTSLLSMPVPSLSSISPLSKLIALLSRSALENEIGIRNEGGRVLVNIIRCIYRTSESNSLPYIVQIITGNYQHRATAESDVGQVDSQSNQSQIFPIVQNEVNPQISHKICRYGWSLVNSLAVILQSDTAHDKKRGTASLSFEAEEIHYPVETKANTCTLLKLLVAVSKDLVKDLVFLIPTLEELTQSKAAPSLKVKNTRLSPEPANFDDNSLSRKLSSSFKGIIGDSSKKELRKLSDGSPDSVNSTQSLKEAAGDLLSLLKEKTTS